MSYLKSPFKKKAKLSDKKTLFDDKEELNALESQVEVVEIIYTKTDPLFKIDDDLRITEVLSGIPLYIGDHIAEYMGVDLRGKSFDVFLTLRRKQLRGDKITMKVFRVNTPKIYLKRDIEVIYKGKQGFKVSNTITFL